jgi:hypothetical protein
MDFIMAELKTPATTDDAKKLLESALGNGQTVQGLLDKTPSIVKGNVKDGLDKTINQIVETINKDPNKTSDSIIATLKANQTITENIAALNKNKSAVGLTQDVSVDSIKPALEAFLQANKVEQAQNKSNETLTATTPTPPTPTTPSTTPTLTQEQQVLKAQEEAKLKEEAEKKKNPFAKAMEELGKRNFIGALMAILPMLLGGGFGVADNQPAPTNQVASNPTTPANNPNDVALPTTTQPQTPAQNQQTTAVTPPPATPNVPPKIIAGVYK